MSKRKRESEATTSSKAAKLSSGATPGSQKRTMVYCGAEGSYSEMAAREWLADKGKGEAGFEGVASIRAVFAAVQNGDGTVLGCVPMENSESGTFMQTLTELLTFNCHIVGESAAIEEHCLCALPGTKIDAVTQVYSDSNVLFQSEAFLEALAKKNGKAILAVPYWDTAASCAFVKKAGDGTFAAIASRFAAEKSGLEVIESKLAKDANVATRFIIIGKDACPEPEYGVPSKISIAVTTHHEPGALFKVIGCFSMRDLNIVRVDARPASAAADLFVTRRHWEYVFQLDFEPHPTKKDAASAALNNLREFAANVAVLGHYESNVPKTKPEPTTWTAFL